MNTANVICNNCIYMREPNVLGVPGAPSQTVFNQPQGLKVLTESLKEREAMKKEEEQFHKSNPTSDMPKPPVFYRWCDYLSTKSSGITIYWALCRVKNKKSDCQYFISKLS